MAAEPLLGKHALIMGPPADIAEPVALTLAKAGANVALTTATNDAEAAFALRRITRGVKAMGRHSMNESVDMSIGTAVQIAMRQVAKELGGIDIVVVGPDLRIDKPTERLTDADWSRLLNTNLSAVFYACRSAYREMQSNDPPGGYIVMLTPPLDQLRAGESGYLAARAGVETLVQSLAREWEGSAVKVGSVTVGGGDTAKAASDVLRAVGL